MGWVCNTDELLRLKTGLNAPFNSLWDDIQACGALTAQEKAAFGYEIEAFRKWVKKGPIPAAVAVALGLPGVLLGGGTLCDADAEIREGRDFERKMGLWREKLANAGCKTSSPPVVLDPPKDGKNPLNTTLDNINEILKTTAIVGGIGLGLYGLWLATPIIKELITARAATHRRLRA